MKTSIGIDMFRLSNIKVSSINIAALKRKDYQLKNDSNIIVNRKTKEGLEMVSVRISGDAKFQYLNIEYYKQDSTYNQAMISICLKNIQKNNYNNISLDDIKGFIRFLKGYIKDMYFVDLDFEEAEFSYLEINRNIAIDYKYEEYDRSIRYLLSCAPKTMTKNGIFSSRDSYSNEDNKANSTFYIGNDRHVLKIYDKKEQTNQKDDIDEVEEETMRIEITMKRKSKIREKLGTAILRDLSNEDIDFAFKSDLERLLITPYKTRIKYDVKAIEECINECKSDKKKQWQHFFLERCHDIETKQHYPFLLDIKQVETILMKTDKKSNIKRTIKYLYDKASYNECFFNDDIDKVDELISKIVLK